MDKAKAAVGDFLSKDGKHDTTVHETVNPAVQQEKVIPTRKENITTAIDREVHQDHHHTSVQPIQDREVLPEQHSHQMSGVEHRNIKHGNEQHVKDRLAAEEAQFKNTREVATTQHGSSANAVVAGEHVHHHVHENIQPVIQKETIQPTVVHTTVPIHEVHQNEAKHHNATTLPAISMEEFKRRGGHMSGREERTDAFGGEPRSVGGSLGSTGARGPTSVAENDTSKHGQRSNDHPETTATTASTGTTRNATDATAGTGTTRTIAGSTGAAGATSATGAPGVVGASGSSSRTGAGGFSSTPSPPTTGKKPGLMDRLNPRTDADHDGRAGIMT